MTRNYCDLCKKQIKRADGPIYVSASHAIGGGCYCKDCFFDDKQLTLIRTKIEKNINEEVKFYS